MDTLTKRELEVLNLVSVGMTNKAIGQQLFIETQTVKNHVHNILDKLNLQNRTEAVAHARAGKMLDKESVLGG
jgi:LuxR family maltose regulon positive regulatory protein